MPVSRTRANVVFKTFKFAHQTALDSGCEGDYGRDDYRDGICGSQPDRDHSAEEGSERKKVASTGVASK